MTEKAGTHVGDHANRYDTMLALMKGGSWELHIRSGARLSWSRAVGALHGYAETEEAPTLDVFLARLPAAERDRLIAVVLEAAAEPGRAVTFTYPWTTGAETRHLRARCVAEHDAQGACTQLLGVIQDVTEDTLARSELARASEESRAACRLKSQFLANMSHEIRTPLNAVIGMTSLLLETELSPEQREYATASRASSDALLGLLNDILDLSKIEAGKLVMEERAIEVRTLVREVVASLMPKACEKGVILAADIAPSVPELCTGDPLRIRQVLTNLLANALKFTAEGEVRASVLHDGDFLLLSVSDTGIGIASESLATLFEPFRQAEASTTRRFGGTGLGLAIARDLVERMGGTITVESEVGCGTTFEVSMRAPARSDRAGLPAPAGASSRAEPLEGCFEPMRVLVAEDDDTNALLTRRLLTKMGHAVVRVRDGAEVVGAALCEVFDVILMDVQMPELDGLEATARIRAGEVEMGRRTAILALTANAMKGDEALCIAAGMDGYLSKPMCPRALREALQRWANRR